MRPGAPSRTAEGVAAVRAAEARLSPRGRRLYDDPIAHQLVRGRARTALRWRLILRALVWLNEHLQPGMVWEVLARARYAEDLLRAMARRGVRQCLVLGAGFDATAWLPDLPEDLIVYEVDSPATQALKRARLAQAGLAEPPRVVFVACPLGQDQLARSLRGAGYRVESPALATLLGVLPYLDGGAAQATLREIAAVLAPGSALVFDYLTPEALAGRAAPPGPRRVARRLERMGEPFLFAADPDRMARLAAEGGLSVVEDQDGEAITRSFFSSRGDGRSVAPCVHLARAVVSPGSPS